MYQFIILWTDKRNKGARLPGKKNWCWKKDQFDNIQFLKKSARP